MNINEFNEGGSHGQNPLGGIPVGMNQQTGQLQTVEEGETMSKLNGSDFIFSTKYHLTSEDIEQLGLPKNLSGLSMSDATKKLNDLYKDREDPISTTTKNTFLERIAEAQEVKKMAEEQMIQEALQMNADAGYIDPAAMGESPMGGMVEDIPAEDDGAVVPEGMGMLDPTQMQFNAGGFLGMKGMTGGAATQQGIDAGIGAISGGLNLIDIAGGNTSPNSGIAALGGAATGASVGSSIMPGVGTAIGAGVGAITGLFGAGAARKKIRRAETNRANAAISANGDTEMFANGGFLDTLDYSPLKKTKLNTQFINQSPITNQSPFANFKPSTNMVANSQNLPIAVGDSGTKKGFDFTGLGNSLGRLAPVVDNFTQLNSMSSPTMNNPILDKSKAVRRYTDTAAMENQVNRQTNNQLSALSKLGGSTGSRRNAILASNLMRNRAMGDVALQVQSMNNQVDDRADMLDMQTGKENLQRLAIAQENYDRDLGAYNTNKSKLQSTMATNIGNVALENKRSKMVQAMYGYDSMGNYVGSGNDNPDYQDLNDNQLLAIQKNYKEGDKSFEEINRVLKQRQLDKFNRTKAQHNAFVNADNSFMSVFGNYSNNISE